MAWLIGAAVVLGYLGHLYLHPFGPCRRCKGKRTNRGSSKKSWGKCKRCGGSGERQRLGSRQLHRGARSLAAARRNRKDN
jgi:DnaJ-class molecular chaperone